jgi:hypothetical protein
MPEKKHLRVVRKSERSTKPSILILSGNLRKEELAGIAIGGQKRAIERAKEAFGITVKFPSSPKDAPDPDSTA